MNEKLKFNLNRLKKDFEDVIDELVEETKIIEISRKEEIIKELKKISSHVNISLTSIELLL